MIRGHRFGLQMRNVLPILWMGLYPISAQAEAVKLSDLEGYTVDSLSVMDQRIRREGREIQVQVHTRTRIFFHPFDVITITSQLTSIGPRGSSTRSQKGSVALGKVNNEVRNPDGGQSVWLFEDGALTTLRTFGSAGGFKRNINFTRDGEGFACSTTSALVREQGVGRLAARAPGDNVLVTILSSRQSSSACKIFKDAQPERPK